MQTWKKKSHSGYTVKHLRYNYPSTYQLMYMETEVVKKKKKNLIKLIVLQANISLMFLHSAVKKNNVLNLLFSQ